MVGPLRRSKREVCTPHRPPYLRRDPRLLGSSSLQLPDLGLQRRGPPNSVSIGQMSRMSHSHWLVVDVEAESAWNAVLLFNSLSLPPCLPAFFSLPPNSRDHVIRKSCDTCLAQLGFWCRPRHLLRPPGRDCWKRGIACQNTLTTKGADP